VAHIWFSEYVDENPIKLKHSRLAAGVAING
jgi:hypothetical protein